MNDKSKDLSTFKANRSDELKKLYADEQSRRQRQGQKPNYAAKTYNNAEEVRTALQDAISNKTTLVETSNKLYTTNPIYSAVINYLSNMFMWRYTVTPHRVNFKKGRVNKNEYEEVYRLMLEVADGLSIESKFPEILTRLFVQGSLFFTTACDEDSITIDTIVLPDKYCRKIGETQHGTGIIEFDFSYFDSCGLKGEDLEDFLASFPEEFESLYREYKKDTKHSWLELDPRFSSCVMLNEVGIPTYVYILGGILDYEKYQDNELERNENQLKYLVTHKMPIYQDKLVFEVDEVAALHKSLKKIIDVGDKARLMTTFGDVDVKKIAENDTAENQVLSKAFKAIFNNAGFNSGIFTSESVEALKMSLIRDKGIVWKYVQQILNFYNIAINNWFDFKNYQADIEILPISLYTYNDDISTYKNNATLGVGKVAYLVAAGIKQKNIQDMLELESFLHLEDITPMQTSYTQTAEDRADEGGKEKTQTKENVKETDNQSDKTEPGIEPLDKEELVTSENQ